MIDRAEPNLTTTQLYSTENHYPPRVSVAPSRPSSLPLMTGRSVSAVGMSCSGTPCAPLHTLHRCGGIHSRGRRNIHHSTRNYLVATSSLFSLLPLLLLIWASSLVESRLDAQFTFTGANAHSEDKWSVSRQCWHVLSSPSMPPMSSNFSFCCSVLTVWLLVVQHHSGYHSQALVRGRTKEPGTHRLRMHQFPW